MGDTMRLDVHGVVVGLSGNRAAVRELATHFSTFCVPEGAAPEPSFRVILERKVPVRSTSRRLLAAQILERGVVYNDGAVTWVDHGGFATSRYDFTTETGTVSAGSQSDLRELGYLMLQSRLGPMLESRGLVRAHGLGFVYQGGAVLVLLPSGGGKSRLALSLLHNRAVQLLSDDIVLLDRRGFAHPFPMPIGLSDPKLAEGLGPTTRFHRRQHGTKLLLGLDHIEDRLAKSPAPVSAVVVANRVCAPPSRLVRTSRREAAAALWRDAVVGMGLPQVVEFFLRHGARDLLSKGPTVARRAAVASAVLARSRCFRLEIDDVDSAVQALVDMPRG